MTATQGRVERPTSRWRTSQPPASWNVSAGPASGVVELPLRLHRSDRHNRFNLADDAELRLLYQIVLAEGTANDVERFLNMATLLNIWDRLWLPRAVHEAWDPWIAGHRRVTV